MKIPKSLSIFTAFFALAGSLLHAAEPMIQSGQKLAFMGDSITRQGAQNSCGYVNLVKVGLEANGIDVEVIPAGISGHKSNQMLARLQKDVLDKQPDWMTLSCGVNDVWHRANGVNLEDFKKNITEIVDRCAEAGVKVMIMTATPIKEVDNELNQKLAGYNDFLRELAAKRKLPLADTNTAFLQIIETSSMPVYKGLYLTVDGVHMNPIGDRMMATEVLKAFGINEAQLINAQTAWDVRLASVRAATQVRVEDYVKLRELAERKEMSIGHMLNLAFKNAVHDTLSEYAE